MEMKKKCANDIEMNKITQKSLAGEGKAGDQEA